MKLLWAECCASLVVPNKVAYKVTYCGCRKSAIWWEDPYAGKVAIYGWTRESVNLIGLHNGLLTMPLQGEAVVGASMRHLIEATEDTYLFKRWNSLVIRCRPGFSNDSRFVGVDEFNEVLKLEINR